jgi:hypothetical protein
MQIVHIGFSDATPESFPLIPVSHLTPFAHPERSCDALPQIDTVRHANHDPATRAEKLYGLLQTCFGEWCQC